MAIGRVPGATGIQPSIVDAKGDLIAATAADSVSRLAVGANGTVLTADSAEATGLKWAAAGKILQVVYGSYASAEANSTSTFADTGLSASITPSSTSSKVLVIAQQSSLGKDTGDAQGSLRLMRGATQLVIFGGGWGKNQSTSANGVGGSGIAYLDSPSTTSATTYKTQFRSDDNNARVLVQYGGANGTATIILMEVGA